MDHSKDRSILQFFYHYVRILLFCFEFFRFICDSIWKAFVNFNFPQITNDIIHDIFTKMLHSHRKFLIPYSHWQEVQKIVTPCLWQYKYYAHRKKLQWMSFLRFFRLWGWDGGVGSCLVEKSFFFYFSLSIPFFVTCTFYFLHYFHFI